MKVLLINPPMLNMIRTELPAFLKKNMGYLPPLGLAYIYSYLKENLDCYVGIVDCVPDRISYKKLEHTVKQINPDIIGITVHSHNLIDAILVSKLSKKFNSDVHICMGGSHVNIYPEETINFPWVDSVIIGEGELSFCDLVSRLMRNKNLPGIKGLYYKTDGNVNANNEKVIVQELDSLPFPERKVLGIDKYYYRISKSVPFTTMLTTRGCPFNCSFCSTPKTSFRERTVKNIIDEIKSCINMGFKEIYFVDDVFSLNKSRILNLCDQICENGISMDWSFRTRVDCIDEEILKEVKLAGCYRIHYGIETSTEEGLEILNKSINIRQIKEVLNETKKNGLESVTYFMIGCPHENDVKAIRETVEFAINLNPTLCMFNILTLYPDTLLHEKALKNGLLQEDIWKKFANNPSIEFKIPFWEKYFNRKQLYWFLNYSYKKFYLRLKLFFSQFGYVALYRFIKNQFYLISNKIFSNNSTQ